MSNGRDLLGRIVCKYSCKYKSVDNGFDGDSVWVNESLSVVSELKTNPCIKCRILARCQWFMASIRFHVGIGMGKVIFIDRSPQ